MLGGLIGGIGEGLVRAHIGCVLMYARWLCSLFVASPTEDLFCNINGEHEHI